LLVATTAWLLLSRLGPENASNLDLEHPPSSSQKTMSAVHKLSAVTIKPASKHTATVFILHGLGDTGHGWSDVAEMLRGKMPWVKWVLPHAPQIAVTLNGGMRMVGERSEVGS
jgi:hypothetical protein